MKLTKLIASAALAASCFAANAANDVYGVVSEIITRTGPNGDHQIYFRMEVDKAFSQFESCVADTEHMVWRIDVTSPVLDAQYDLIKKSYIKKKSLRVIGYDDVCDSGDVYSDKVFELSPYNWKSRTPPMFRR